MELGGDAPVLIFADVADVKSVVSDVVGLKFANAGQICVSPNRVYVQEEVRWTFVDVPAAKIFLLKNVSLQIYDEVVQHCKALADKYVYGVGDDHAPKEEVMQPMVSSEAVMRLEHLVKDATTKARIAIPC